MLAENVFTCSVAFGVVLGLIYCCGWKAHMASLCTVRLLKMFGRYSGLGPSFTSCRSLLTAGIQQKHLRESGLLKQVPSTEDGCSIFGADMRVFALSELKGQRCPAMRGHINSKRHFQSLCGACPAELVHKP